MARGGDSIPRPPREPGNALATSATPYSANVRRSRMPLTFGGSRSMTGSWLDAAILIRPNPKRLLLRII